MNSRPIRGKIKEGEPRNFDHFEKGFFIENPEISEITDSRIHGFTDVWHIGAREISEVLRGFAEVCGGLRDQRHSNQAQSSRLKIILESLNL